MYRGTWSHTDTADIMTFVQYYSRLYAQIPEYSEAELEQLLAPLPLPTQSALDRNNLEADITDKEIELAIRGLPPHKAPGPDGFSSEW